ncbi:MAG TPA: hypothetical protein DHU75_08500 [Rikenellaceae bacterium]|nr:hypothetical protein [Rikenellaceae bacterium]
MNKEKIFINLISIALLLLYSMEGQSVTFCDKNISCIELRSKKIRIQTAFSIPMNRMMKLFLMD